jgi:hypothetical protein
MTDGTRPARRPAELGLDRRQVCLVDGGDRLVGRPGHRFLPRYFSGFFSDAGSGGLPASCIDRHSVVHHAVGVD